MADGQDQMGMFETSPTDERPPGQPGEDRDLRPGRDPESALPVSEVNAAARELLEESFPLLWVTGEIANWRRVSSGHCYFSLRDEDAQISCVMWRRNARRLPTEPEEGMEVCAHGQVSLYEARGAYQLMVRELQARGEGLWRLAFERLKKKLAAEGLLEDARKRPTPRVPGRVAVVTSRSGAALRDVVSVIRRRAPWTDILVADCRVQGEEAAPEIVAALERLGRRDDVDVAIVTRGGGSVEDLWAFNEEPVARAVANSPIPVISAVGHEVDVTIADLVADVRAPTPSAAAEVAVPAQEALRAEVAGLATSLAEGLRSRVRRSRDRAGRYAERLVSAVRRRLERARGRTERLGARLDALSPLATLRRGYAVPTDAEGRVLRRRESFEGVEQFRLRVVDGRIESRVENVEPAPEPDAGGGGR